MVDLPQRQSSPTPEPRSESEQDFTYPPKVGERLVAPYNAERVVRVHTGSWLVASPWRAVFAAMFGGAFVAILSALEARAGLPLLPILLVHALLVGIFSLWPTRVSVGRDGVAIGWLGMETFVPHTSIEQVAITPLGIVLMLVNGRRIPLRTSLFRGRRNQDRLVKILDEMAAPSATGGSLDLEVLHQKDRPFETWLETLRSLGSRVGTFRTESDIDSLERVATDPAEPLPRRVAALVAISPSLDDARRQRLRISAESSAAPQFRAAVEAADQADEETLRSLLASVSEPD